MNLYQKLIYAREVEKLPDSTVNRLLIYQFRGLRLILGNSSPELDNDYYCFTLLALCKQKRRRLYGSDPLLSSYFYATKAVSFD